VQEEQLNRLIHSGLQVISCGANVPFADSEIFYGPIAEKAATTVSLIPDFIANCGMARVFSYLMSLEDEKMRDACIFEDTSTIIKNALQAIKKKSPERTLITQQAFTNALQQLM
ncbi:MAG: amino acid dehydrogenase, partial [Flavobacteriales bacterium]